MVQQTRLFPPILGAVFLAAMLSCRGSGTPSARRLGDDMLMTGSSAYMRDSVPGDVIFAAGEVDYSAGAGGDYLGVGGKQSIRGRIHGALRAAGGEVSVAANVDGNTTITGGNVVLDSAAAIGGNVYLAGGNVEIHGAVRQALLATGGSVTLNGVVGRDVEISAGEFKLGPRAQIAGNLRYKAKKVHIDPAARVTGTVTAIPTRSGIGLWSVLWFLGILLAGVVIVALFPRFMSEAAAILAARPVRSGIVGLCWGILIPIAIVVAAVTRIGIPLALLTTAVYLVVFFVGGIPFSLWLGQRILRARPATGLRRVLVAFLIGGTILQLVELLPIVGPLLGLVAGILGVGTIVLRAWASRRESAVLASV